MKKNTIILSSVIVGLLFLIWYQNYHYTKNTTSQNKAYQDLLHEKHRTDSLFTYYDNLQKAQYYFLNDQDSLALELLKPYGKISDSIQNHIKQIKHLNQLNTVAGKSFLSNKSESLSNQEATIDAVLAENIIVKNQLALTKFELEELKTPKAMLDLVSSKGVKFQYIGQIKNGNANGFGIGFFESGSVYKGFWKDNMRHGNGVFTWKDGERYEGNYVEDKREGSGDYFWKNGEVYKGQWKNDKRNGSGKLYKKSGKIKKEGNWVDDEFKS